jgi:hypothetical protein
MNPAPSLQARQDLSGKWPKLQRELVNWQLPRGAVLWLVVIIVSCAPPEVSPAQAGAAWSGNESAAYRAGHGEGSRDRREGRPHSPEGRQPDASFREGYDAGYRNPHDNPWSRPRARDLGASHGRNDRANGRTKDAMRHAGVVPRAVRDDFRLGYETAWD